MARTGSCVPRISEFYGIVIFIYHDEHPPPHFHARYAEYWAAVSIATGEVVRGELPVRAARLVRQWSGMHRVELEANWNRIAAGEALVPIDPLP